ncbi:hypothetical protein P5P86_16115 [Nocardioides sp. BP30]|uniref:endonuclease/exonuclease/phosphatase family protein n=1 Tax=Nocardioides sp. BP30 TaxID=3036374 RepID=UPI00246930B4|nr:endonuclease/exonuclease/phosphatase family protein [Nocardioides sp. BP30]WGL51479.1 hypothetical protein P5P86_16115 [Nocardioides sp. BP30]
MGSHRGHRAPRPRRRIPILPALAGLLGLALVAGLVVDLTAGGPVSGLFTTSASSTSGSPSGSTSGRPTAGQVEVAAPAKVVPGERLARHVPTAAELDAIFAKRGLERVGKGGTRVTEFKVSSFNVLGAIHTSTKKSAHPRWPSGPSRVGRVAALLRSYDISVVGMQELETPQLRAFEGAAPEYAVYPGTSVGGTPSDNSIAWRTADWTLVEADLTPIPYYGAPVRMPHVLLRNKHTGRLVWFANYHNPSDDHGNAQGKRNEAVRIEAALVKRLSADGTPVIQTGDFNDRQEAACPMMTQADMHASDGAEISGGSCRVPMKPYPTVDWVFGTGDVDFSGHVADWSTRDREISDHEMIRTSATVAARTSEKGCLTRTVGGKKLWWCPRAETSPSAG